MKKDINKRLTSLLMAGITLVTIPTLTSCSKKYKMEILPISQDSNEFHKYKKTIIKNGEPATVYLGQNIVITVDKDTFDLKEYIFVSNNIDEINDIYDLRTETLLVNKVETEVDNYSWNSKDNYNKITNNKYIIPLVDVGDYIEGEMLKDKYSLIELEELEAKILDSVKKIDNYEKVKTKTLS